VVGRLAAEFEDLAAADGEFLDDLGGNGGGVAGGDVAVVEAVEGMDRAALADAADVDDAILVHLDSLEEHGEKEEGLGDDRGGGDDGIGEVGSTLAGAELPNRPHKPLGKPTIRSLERHN